LEQAERQLAEGEAALRLAETMEALAHQVVWVELQEAQTQMSRREGLAVQEEAQEEA
jgi:hypothetical protein